MMKNDSENRIEVGMTCKSMRKEMENAFSVVRFSHTNRKNNVVSHLLARLAYQIDFAVWIEEGPNTIKAQVMYEKVNTNKIQSFCQKNLN